MNSISISRRKFAQLLSAGAACAVVKPALSLAKTAPPVKNQSASPLTRIVRLSSNENPYGPSPHALKAMTDSFDVACRYPDEAAARLSEKLATLNSVSANQILLGDGSGEILKLCADTFTGAQRKLVAGDPTFEAILQHATVNGAEVVKVPLTDNFAHDLNKMGTVANAGLVYICNPNNPTASFTPKNELTDFISKTSPQTIILVDEAYFHYADSPDYDSVIPLIKDHPNLIVARTLIASHCATALSSKLGQRQYYGGGGCDGESERPRPGYKRPAAESGNQDVCDDSARRHGLQIHSFASELCHDRCKTPRPAADQGIKGTKCGSGPIISSIAKSHAPDHRQKGRDGDIFVRLPSGLGLKSGFRL